MAAQNQGGGVRVHLNGTRGDFTPGPRLAGTLGTVSSGDLDLDGDLDLISSGQEALAVFFHTKPGVHEPGPELFIDDGLAGIRNPFAKDLDGDGDLDIVTASSFRSDLILFFQSSPGEFETERTLGGLGVTNGPTWVAAGDLDQDGDLDLVCANGGTTFPEMPGDNLTLFFQTDPGEFELGATLGDETTTAAPSTVKIGDLDSDGDLDLVTTHGTTQVVTFLQTNPGEFELGPVLDGIQSIEGVLIADLDADGKQDLCVEERLKLSLFFQTNPGEFSPARTVSFPPPSLLTGGAIAADVDADGDQDIVLASFFGVTTTVRVAYQVQPGVFTVGPVLPGSENLFALAFDARDFDGDRDVDIAAASIFNGITFFFGSH